MPVRICGVQRCLLPESSLNTVRYKVNRAVVYEVLHSGAIRNTGRVRHGNVSVTLHRDPPEEALVLGNLEALSCTAVMIWETPDGRRGFLGVRTEGRTISLRLDSDTHKILRLLAINADQPIQEVITRAIRLLAANPEVLRTDSVLRTPSE